MRICFDTETPTRYAIDGIPDLVCLTWSPEDDKQTGRIAVGNDAIDLWDSWIADPTVTLVAHNAPFDVCVCAKASAIRAGTYTLPGFGPAFELVFRAYDHGRIIDTIPDQRLIDVARGRPGDDTRMGTLAKRLLGLGMSDDKSMPKAWKHLLGEPVQTWPVESREATPWRFKYGLLAGVPLEHWPAEPRRYACEDPVITWGIRDWQEKITPKTFGGSAITNSREQTRSALDLHMHSLTGFATDRPRVQRIAGLYAEVERVCSDLLATHCALCGGPVPPTPSPRGVKAAIKEEAPPEDPRFANCAACKERTMLVREEITWEPHADGRPRAYKGREMAQTVTRKRSRKAAQRLVWRVLGARAPLTKTHAAKRSKKCEATISSDADTLVTVAAHLASGRASLLGAAEVLAAADAGTFGGLLTASDLPVVNAIRWHSRAQKYQTAFLAPLDTARRVRTSYQVCKDSGRTSARKPNVQNFPRPDDKLAKDLDIRSCIVPDPGYVFLVCDYAQIELVAFAHVLSVLGRMQGRGDDYESSLATAINAGMDGHIKVACEVLHMPYDECLAVHLSAKGKAPITWTDLERSVERWRQVGKIKNYGAAGGMGAATFVTHASKQDATISLQESQAVSEGWLRAWSPDVQAYFKYLGKLTNNGTADATQLYSGRKRGRCTFTQLANSMFQGLTADGFKEAMRLIIDANFRQPLSPLFGCRPVLEAHDEFVQSCEVSRALDAAAELSRLMRAGMAKFIPDVKIIAECSIMDRWGKG